jgi:acyl-CoA synthetase (NDP forming)
LLEGYRQKYKNPSYNPKSYLGFLIFIHNFLMIIESISKEMSINSSTNHIIKTFLFPKSVAVFGASKNPLKGGNRIVNNLVYNQFEGNVYPINPNANGEVFGLKFNQSILEIEDDVDVAIFYVPNVLIPDLLKECISKKVKGAIIEASGFEEVGDAGKDLTNEIIKITNDFSKIHLVGPNCMGLSRIDTDSSDPNKRGFFSGFGLFTEYKRGNIGIISQSGMLNGGYLMHLFTKYPEMGFRYSCSIGNKMDVGENEFLEFMIEDDTVNVIAIYLESFQDPKKFIQLCRKAYHHPKKAIMLVKGGITEQGQNASLSHTGALSENRKLIEAIVKQAGVVSARSFHELFQYARTFSMMYNTDRDFPVNGNASMVAGSGGAGTITADLSKLYEIDFPSLSERTYKVLENYFPEWMPPNKFSLVDIWPAVEKAMMNNVDVSQVLRSVYKALLDEPEIEGIFNMMFCSKLYRHMSDVELILDLYKETSKPFFFWLVGEFKEVKRVSRKLNDHQIPDFESLEELVKNFRKLVDHSRIKADLDPDV